MSDSNDLWCNDCLRTFSEQEVKDDLFCDCGGVLTVKPDSQDNAAINMEKNNTASAYLTTKDNLSSSAYIQDYGTAGSQNPLYGVKGWLKLFVVVTLYVSPVIFVLRQIMGWSGILMLAGEYPKIILVGLIEAGVGGFLVVKWIQIAKRLRDIRQGAVREAKSWLQITLGWNILSTPLAFMSGIDSEYLLAGAFKGVILSLISFTIWYSYFTHSKRVKATYPRSDM